VSFLFSSLYAGIATTIGLDSPRTSVDLEGVVSYADKNHQLTARVKHTLQNSIVNLGLSYYFLLNSKWPFAIEVNSDTAFDKLSVNLGAEKKVDQYTTVKGKTVFRHSKKETEIRSGLALKQQICPCLWATFGSDLNLAKFLGNDIGEPHSFGIELKFINK